MAAWTQLPFRWRRSALLVFSLVLFIPPWLTLAGESYAGYGFRDLAVAVRAAAEAPLAAPITWDLVMLQPAAALAGLIVVQRGLSRKAADFLAAFAVFVGPIAIVMALFEVPEVSLEPAGYGVLALAVMALAFDFRPGLARRKPDDPEGPKPAGG